MARRTIDNDNNHIAHPRSRCTVSVGLAQARPNYDNNYIIIHCICSTLCGRIKAADRVIIFVFATCRSNFILPCGIGLWFRHIALAVVN